MGEYTVTVRGKAPGDGKIIVCDKVTFTGDMAKVRAYNAYISFITKYAQTLLCDYIIEIIYDNDIIQTTIIKQSNKEGY